MKFITVEKVSEATHFIPSESPNFCSMTVGKPYELTLVYGQDYFVTDNKGREGSFWLGCKGFFVKVGDEK